MSTPPAGFKGRGAAANPGNGFERLGGEQLDTRKFRVPTHEQLPLL